MDAVLEKVEIEVPQALKEYVLVKDRHLIDERNALLLYPYILNRRISHGKAAQILGMNKLDLIDLYEEMGFSYLDLTMDELDDDLETLEKLGVAGSIK